MKISRIEIYKSKIKLKVPFVISLGPLHHAENIIVVIRTGEGHAGFGECSPFMTINGESMDTCFVVASYLAKKLKGMDPLQIEDCCKAMDSVIYGNTSIKSAFDMALYDIASAHARLPLYAFLGGSLNRTLFTDYTVSFGDPDKMAQDAKQIKESGFRYIKVKLGGTKEKDVERIRLIRQSTGNDIPLRIDANQGWSDDTALNILNALAPFGIEYCEEPMPRWDFMKLPEIKRQSPVRIMADESCFSHHDAGRLIALKACDYFNVKLGKSGGIFNALKIIELADQAGIKMQAGGFLESRLGFTAAAHMAMACNGIVFYDFDTPLMLEEDPVSGGIIYGNGGEVILPTVNGLGASIDRDYLSSLEHVVV
jgi:L-alanine-DL-glutamate epimerase-like enolase superfamily enzyme